MLRTLRALTRKRERAKVSRYFTKAGYRSRERPEYFADVLRETEGVVHQPHVYPFAAHLAARYGCTHVIDLGCGRAQKLAPLHPEFQPVGVDIGANVEWCRETYRFGEWIEWDFERPGALPIAPELARRSVVVCADVIEHLVDPTHLLSNLRLLLEEAPVALLSTPERDLVRGSMHTGPPDNVHHAREWNLDELQALLEWARLRPSFVGLTSSRNDTLAKTTTLAVLEGARTPIRRPAPDSFRVVAGMCVHNEADIMEGTFRFLQAEGVEVYVLDNWSTDGTAEIAEGYLGRGVVGLERFPREGPAPAFEWHAALRRLEELALDGPNDWFILADADGRVVPPWPGVTLRDALHYVDRCGFNCVDHTVLDFRPTDDDFCEEHDLEEHLRRFEFGRRPGHFLQRKAWKKLGRKVDMASTGGHDAQFDGRRIYPYKFLLKHYPIRSQRHGERKVFAERLPRWSREEREAGWHIQYDALGDDRRFLREPEELEEFVEPDFSRRYLVERLSGIGLRGELSEHEQDSGKDHGDPRRP